MSVRIEAGDCRDVLKTLADNSIDSVVTDPPYALVSISKRFGSPTAKPTKGKDAYMRAARGFMSVQWDNGETAFDPNFWREVLRVLKPGGHIVAFGGTRTFHRLACAIEDAGFEIRDMVAWLYGSGFPKSHNVGKAIDRAAGAEREVVGIDPQRLARLKNQLTGSTSTGGQWEHGLRDVTVTAPATDLAREWEGWGTALKPALEPICLARKPLDGTVAANVLEHGTGALNIDGCRVGTEGGSPAPHAGGASKGILGDGLNGGWGKPVPGLGRWPANVVHDGSEEVERAFPDTGAAKSGERGIQGRHDVSSPETARLKLYSNGVRGVDDAGGSAARFFYSAKADADDRLGSKHPTVKPVDLMRWLVRLVTPPGGTVLDPFAGSGTTAMAAMAEGFNAIVVEREAQYLADIRRRVAHVSGEDTPLFGGGN